ncbi:MAG: hypothetical protein ABSB22_16635 [Thermodesulfobacteriota bacterium]
MILLKIILYAYSRGITSSRKIARSVVKRTLSSWGSQRIRSLTLRRLQTSSRARGRRLFICF